jgi:hypothetical protein
MKKPNYPILLGTAMLSLALAFSSVAQVTWTAKCWWQGPTRDGSPIPPTRSNPASAEVAQGVSANVGDFFSLGHQGYIILEASAPFGPTLAVSEVTFGNPPCDNIYRERAEIFVSQTGMGWVSLGIFCHDGGVLNLGALDWARYVKIVDMTNNSPDPTPQPNDGVDFYDVDGLVAMPYEGDPNQDPVCTATAQGKSWNGVTNVHPLRSMENKARVLEGLTVAQTLNTNLRDNSNQMNFFSLGYGGEICYSFSPVVVDLPGPDFQIFETTWKRNGSNPNGCTMDYPEKAEIWVSADGNNYFLAGVQCKDYGAGSALTNGFFDINGTVPFVKFLKIKDITDKTKHKAGSDAFDVDGIRVLNDFEFNPNPPPFMCPEPTNGRQSIDNSQFLNFEMPVYEGGIPEEMPAMQVVGNPVASDLKIAFMVGEDGPIEFIIRDFTGREVLRQHYLGAIYTMDEISLPTSNLPAGNYMVTLHSATYKEVARFVKK